MMEEDDEGAGYWRMRPVLTSANFEYALARSLSGSESSSSSSSPSPLSSSSSLSASSSAFRSPSPAFLRDSGSSMQQQQHLFSMPGELSLSASSSSSSLPSCSSSAELPQILPMEGHGGADAEDSDRDRKEKKRKRIFEADESCVGSVLPFANGLPQIMPLNPEEEHNRHLRHQQRRRKQAQEQQWHSSAWHYGTGHAGQNMSSGMREERLPDNLARRYQQTYHSLQRLGTSLPPPPRLNSLEHSEKNSPLTYSAPATLSSHEQAPNGSDQSNHRSLANGNAEGNVPAMTYNNDSSEQESSIESQANPLFSDAIDLTVDSSATRQLPNIQASHLRSLDISSIPFTSFPAPTSGPSAFSLSGPIKVAEFLSRWRPHSLQPLPGTDRSYYRPLSLSSQQSGASRPSQTEEIDLTNEDAMSLPLPKTDENSEPDEDEICMEIPFGQVPARIVSVSYFTGILTERETVRLIRAPSIYDSSPIRVDNVSNQEIGYIEKKVSACFAPLLDRRLVRLQAIIAQKPVANSSIHITLQMFGQPQHKNEVLDKVNEHNLVIERYISYVPTRRNTTLLPDMYPTSGTSYSSALQLVGGTSSGAPSLSEIEGDIEKLFKSLQDQAENLQEQDPPEPVITPLFPHQKQALYWMSNKEQIRNTFSDEYKVLFWQKRTIRGETVYFNTATNSTVKQLPPYAQGGILADDMGLGKTLCVISLIISDLVQHKKSTASPSQLELQHNTSSPLTLSSKDKEKDEDSLTAKSNGLDLISSATTTVLNHNQTEDTENKQMKDLAYEPEEMSISSAQQPIVLDDSDSPRVLEDDDVIFSPLKQPQNGKYFPLSQEPTTSTTTAEKPTATLIVCPLSILSNWEFQISQHVSSEWMQANDISVYTYHGPQRTRDVEELKKHTIVITTYNILATEFMDETSKAKGKRGRKKTPGANNTSISADRAELPFLSSFRISSSTTASSEIVEIPSPSNTPTQSPLQEIRWLRVVLDEGHVIKTRSTRQAKAAFALKAERRWVLTGTPIQNKLDDLYSLVHFLRVHPFENYDWWTSIIVRPMQMEEPKGYQRLQALVGSICLRRTKDQHDRQGRPLVGLPDKKIFLERLQFSPEERERYDDIVGQGRQIFRTYMNQGTLLKNYAHVLEMLLRLRQVCCHTRLAAPKPPAYGSDIDDEKAQHLLALLQDGEGEECCICLSALSEPVITSCSHIYCKPCITRVMELSPLCPLCRSPISTESLLVPPPTVHNSDIIIEREKLVRSTKTKALLEHIKLMRNADPSTKCVIFSQWTSFLDILRQPLTEDGIGFVCLDGRMPHQKRKEVMQQFNSEPSITALLISLKAGGVGLNLTAASVVFIMDPWWNPAGEEQAMDRVHRLGQTKQVKCIRFVIKNSVEEKMLKLQEKKRCMVQGAFGKRSIAELQAMRISDLKLLFDDDDEVQETNGSL